MKLTIGDWVKVVLVLAAMILMKMCSAVKSTLFVTVPKHFYMEVY